VPIPVGLDHDAQSGLVGETAESGGVGSEDIHVDLDPG
jgi:hypothetical protein